MADTFTETGQLSLQALLFELRVAVNQMRVELDHRPDTAQGEHGTPAAPGNVTTHAVTCLTRLDEVISGIHGYLEPRARRATPTRSAPSSLDAGPRHPRARRATAAEL